jgi:hypothetical protein
MGFSDMDKWIVNFALLRRRGIVIGEGRGGVLSANVPWENYVNRAKLKEEVGKKRGGEFQKKKKGR